MRGFSQAQRDRAATELWSLKVRGCSELGSRGAGRRPGEKNLPLPRSAVCKTSNSPGGTFPHHLRSRVSNPGRATESSPEGVPKPFCFGSPGCRCPLDRRLGPRAGSHSPPAHDGRCGHRGEAQGSAGRSLRWSQANQAAEESGPTAASAHPTEYTVVPHDLVELCYAKGCWYPRQLRRIAPPCARHHRGAARRGGGQGRAGGVLHGRPRSARGPAAKKAEERFIEVFVGRRPGFPRRLPTR